MCNAQGRSHDVLLIIKRSHTNDAGISIRQWLDANIQVAEVSDWLPRGDIARVLEHFRPDVIHGHLRRSTRMLARLRPTAPTVATLHITVNGPHFSALDGIICIARWQHNDIPANYRGLVFDIKLGYVPHRRLSPAEIAARRAELGVGPRDFLIGGVGRLAKSKGFDTLIEAFKRAKLSDAKLAIFGDGRERGRLDRLCTRDISLPGFRSEIKDYYQVFDLFVCPSRREPLPYVLLEALDAGVPIAASNALGNAELLETFPGSLFAVDDIEALSSLLGRYRADPPPKAAQDLSSYAFDTVMRQTEAAYHQLIARKQNRR
jgi:glycosyltransferase involved in cell wall biosynthesis